MSKTIIDKGIKGDARLPLLRLHRLREFQKSFNAYLAGRGSAAQVKRRAELMLQSGLPRLR